MTRGSARGLSASAAWVAAVLACSAGGDGELAAPPETAHLPEGVAARVADDPISVQTVSRIAAALGAGPREARDRAVYDALMAAGARERFGADGRSSSAERSLLARALLEQIDAEAQSLGPPSDQEVTELSAERWYDVDRPPSARTSHAVVRVSDPRQKAAARALAERIAQAVRDQRTPADFMRAANGVPKEGLQVVVQSLPATTADGRVYDPDRPAAAATQRFDKAFARAANALSAPGDQTPVVESSFGFHVILLEERLPEKRLAFERRRQLFQNEVISRRASRIERELLERLSAARRVEISRASDELTAKVQVRP